MADSAGAVVDSDIEALVLEIPDAPGPELREENIEFRRIICEMVNADASFARAVNLKCSRDVVFWFNTFVWTQNPKDFPDCPHQPVILFPNQAGYVLTLHDHVERGEPLLLEKSREQLASVATSAYALWRLIYRDNASCLVGSKKKDLVDGGSYAKAIFPKIDYVIRYLPKAMLPEGWNTKKPGPCRKDMAIIHPSKGVAIEGETCNDDFGRGGRFAWLWVDELAFIQKQDPIHTAISNTTNCYVFTTTPKGLELFYSLRMGGNIKVYSLHWTTNYLWHPKGFTPEQCQWDKGIWPEQWICPVGCKVHPNGGMPHSERYDNECKKQNYDSVKIAQELDINYQKSGSAVFDQDKVSAAIRHITDRQYEFKFYRLEFDESKVKSMRMGFNSGVGEDWFKVAKTLPVRAIQVEGGPLKVYAEPFSCRDKACVCRGSGMHTYLLGGDVCQNMDQDAHAGYILDITAGMVVAEWHGKTLSQQDLAVEWAKLCKWYGSATCKQAPDAYAVVEANVGFTVNENLWKLGIEIPINRKESSRKKSKGVQLGVFTDRWNKPYIINQCLQPEIDNGSEENPMLPRLFCPFIGFWQECQTYVYKYSEKSETRPERAKMEAQTRKHHDDRVIALAMAVYIALRYFGRIRGYVSTRPEMQSAMWQRGAA